MNVTSGTVTMLTITDAPKLDPIRVIFMDDPERPGAGGMVVQCFDQAWSAWWGAMGTDVRAFVRSCDAEYIASNLTRGTWGRQLAKVRDSQLAYVVRIAEAVRAALREGSLA